MILHLSRCALNTSSSPEAMPYGFCSLPGLCCSLEDSGEQQMLVQPAQQEAAAAKGSGLEQRWWLPHVVLLCCQLAFAVMHVSSHAVRTSGPPTVCLQTGIAMLRDRA